MCWQKISVLNEAACMLKNITPNYHSRRLSKLTLARTYCNLIRYFNDPKLAYKILYNLYHFVDETEKITTKNTSHIVRTLLKKNLLEIQELKASPKGKVFVTFHFGLFELVPPLLTELFENDLYVIVDADSISRQNRIEYYERRTWEDYRNNRLKFLYVQNRASLLQLLRILKNGGTVLIFIDENKSLNYNKDNYFEINFLHDHHYYIRKSINYLLKKVDADLFSIIINIKENLPSVELTKIGNSIHEDGNEIEGIFYVFEKQLRENPHQWTRWYCIDELDELLFKNFNGAERDINGQFEFNDKIFKKKYTINISNMYVKADRL